MVSETSPTMVEQRTLVSVTFHGTEERIVDPPCIVQFGESCVIDMLLPVEPPEINTLFFHRIQDILKYALHEFLVGIDP